MFTNDPVSSSKTERIFFLVFGEEKSAAQWKDKNHPWFPFHTPLPNPKVKMSTIQQVALLPLAAKEVNWKTGFLALRQETVD